MRDNVIPMLTPASIEAAARRLHPATRAMALVRRLLLSDPSLRIMVGQAVYEMDDVPDDAASTRITIAAGLDEDDPTLLGLWVFIWGDTFSHLDSIHTRIDEIMQSPAAGLWSTGEAEYYTPTVDGFSGPPCLTASWWTSVELV